MMKIKHFHHRNFLAPSWHRKPKKDRKLFSKAVLRWGWQVEDNLPSRMIYPFWVQLAAQLVFRRRARARSNFCPRASRYFEAGEPSLEMASCERGSQWSAYRRFPTPSLPARRAAQISRAPGFTPTSAISRTVNPSAFACAPSDLCTVLCAAGKAAADRQVLSCNRNINL